MAPKMRFNHSVGAVMPWLPDLHTQGRVSRALGDLFTRGAETAPRRPPHRRSRAANARGRCGGRKRGDAITATGWNRSLLMSRKASTHWRSDSKGAWRFAPDRGARLLVPTYWTVDSSPVQPTILQPSSRLALARQHGRNLAGSSRRAATTNSIRPFAVQQHTFDVVMDIMGRYDVDAFT